MTDEAAKEIARLKSEIVRLRESADLHNDFKSLVQKLKSRLWFAVEAIDAAKEMSLHLGLDSSQSPECVKFRNAVKAYYEAAK